MAKRPTRSQADDVTAKEPAAKTRARGRARREIGSEGVANREPDTVKPDTITAGPETISEELEHPDRVKQAPGNAFAAAGTAHREPSEDDIRRRAYQMYVERGGIHGLDFDDWLRAEQELKGERRSS